MKNRRVHKEPSSRSLFNILSFSLFRTDAKKKKIIQFRILNLNKIICSVPHLWVALSFTKRMTGTKIRIQNYVSKMWFAHVKPVTRLSYATFPQLVWREKYKSKQQQRDSHD